MVRQVDSQDAENLPPHPDDYRLPDGTTDYNAWRAALAEWRSALGAEDVHDQGGDHAHSGQHE